MLETPVKNIYKKYFIFNPPIINMLISMQDIINEELKSGWYKIKDIVIIT